MLNPDNNKASIIFWSALLAWAIIFAASFVSFITTDPTGASFTRGLNRAGAFFGWQLLAGIVGIIIWLNFRQHNLNRVERWAVRVPPIMFALLILSMIALFVYGSSSRTLPDAPPAQSQTKPL